MRLATRGSRPPGRDLWGAQMRSRCIPCRFQQRTSLRTPQPWQWAQALIVLSMVASRWLPLQRGSRWTLVARSLHPSCCSWHRWLSRASRTRPTTDDEVVIYCGHRGRLVSPPARPRRRLEPAEGCCGYFDPGRLERLLARSVRPVVVRREAAARVVRRNPKMTTTDQPEPPVDFETLFPSEDLQRLLEAAEATSSIKSVELVEILEAHAFDPIEVGGIIRELEARGFDVGEDDRETMAAVLAAPVKTTTDALQLFLREAGRHPLLTAAQEVELAKRVERDDEEAKQRMVESNLRLVVSIAKNYRNQGLRTST